MNEGSIPATPANIDEAVKTATAAEAIARVLLRQLAQDRDSLAEEREQHRAAIEREKKELQRLRDDAERLLVEAARETSYQKCVAHPGVVEDPNKLLTISQCADRIGVSRRTMQKHVTAGLLPTVRYSARTVKVRPADLDKFVARHVVSQETVRR